MEATKYCVYNKTTDRFLSVGTTVADTATQPLEFLEVPADQDMMTAEWGVWVRPLDAIPTDRVRFPIDVVYLSEDQRVVQGFELTPSDSWPDFGDRPASALILPYHSVDCSRTYPGDQFIICEAEKLVRHLARVPAARDAEPRVSSRADDGAISPLESEVAANPDPEKNFAIGVTGKKAGSRGPRRLEVVPPPAAPPIPEPAQESADYWRVNSRVVKGSVSGATRPQTNLEADEIESVVAQVLQWSKTAGGKAGVYARELDATALPLGSGAAAGLPGRNDAHSTSSQEITGGRQDDLGSLNGNEDQGVVSEGDSEESEFRSPDFEAVISQVLQWAEETGRPVSRAQESKQTARSSSETRPMAPGPSLQGPLQKPDNGASAENGKQDGHSGKSRFGRWADEVTSPLVKVPSARPATGLRMNAPGAVERGDKQPEAPDSLKSDKTSGVQSALHKFKKGGKVLFTAQGVHTLKTRFVKWLDEGDRNSKKVGPSDRRRSNRHALPDLIAYYWTGGTPQAHRIGDISSTGFYLLTKERWVPDTVIRMTLQRTLAGGANSEDAISVLSRVVRWGEDGVGHEFILLDSVDMRSGKLTSGKEKVQEALQHYL